MKPEELFLRFLFIKDIREIEFDEFLSKLKKVDFSKFCSCLYQFLHFFLI